MLYAIVALLVIIVDQWVKFWVSGAIPLSSTGETFIPGILSLVNLHNDGAAFGFLAGGGARIYFIILTGAFTVLVIIALATKFISGRLARWCIVLVAAGGVSNCIDRVIYGYVQDMFKCELFNFPVFNVADIFITVFCILFVIAILFERPRRDEEEDDELFEEDDEEEDAPRLTAKERKAARRAAALAEAAEVEKPVRKSRQARDVDEYEQYKAARAARQQAQPAVPQKKAEASYDPADPFAEWERATARAEAEQAARQQAQQTVATQRKAAYSDLDPSAVPARRGSAAAAQNSAKAAPQTQAAPIRPAAPARPSAPAKSSGAEEFSLEDILAEFK